MDPLNARDLADLADERGGVRLSFFLPTHRAGPQTERNRIRLKNLVRHAEQALRDDGRPAAEIEATLAPARDLQHRAGPLERPSDGLALWLGPDGARHARVPLKLTELVAVGDRFLVHPLLPLLTAGGHFHVLALSQDEIKLFRGSRFGLDEVALDGLPLAMWVTMPRRRPQVHAFVADRGGGGRAVFHGAADHDVEPLVLQHFRRVDRALRDFLAGDDAPLVLAGVRSTQSLYRQVNTHPGLVGGGVDGNARDLGTERLHERAWPLAEPVLRRAETAAADAYRELAGSGHTRTEPAEVLAAAEHGRVDTLFVRADANPRRTGRDAGPLIRPAVRPDPADEPDRAAVATLRHGGTVYAVPRSRMPAAGPVAAVLRY